LKRLLLLQYTVLCLSQLCVGFLGVHHRGQSLSSLRCYYHVDVSIKVECHEVCVCTPHLLCAPLFPTHNHLLFDHKKRLFLGRPIIAHVRFLLCRETVVADDVFAICSRRFPFAWRSRECVSLSPSQTDTFDWKMARRDVFF
jgi:hypothetical protein